MGNRTWTKCLVGVASAGCLLLLSQFALAASADEYVENAREHLSGGEVKAAIIELKNALQKDPSHVRARIMLGTLSLQRNDAPAAAKEFARARDLGAPAGDWMPGYAHALVLQGEFRKVIEEIVPDGEMPSKARAELHGLRGNAYMAQREVDAAAHEFDKALEIDNGNAVARLGKAQILLFNQRGDEALEQLNQVLAEHPGHVESRLVRGDLLRRKQLLDDAAADYARARDESPNNPRAHIGLALVHVAQRDIEAAKQDLVKLREVAQQLPVVNYLQALVSFQEQDYDRASDELQALLRVAPANLQAQLLYGIVSYARQEYTIADDYLTRVLASAPGNPQVVKLVGAARLKLREPERAVEVLSSVPTEQSEDAQLLALLGTALIQSGDNSKGAEYIERAVEIDPEQALLRTQLAVGKIARGDTSGAISELESAVALGQDVVQADVLLVLSYLNKKEYDKAIAASEALEQRMSDSPIPFNLTGLAYLAQRRFEPARQRFDKALEIDPNFVVARMNMARLALVEKKPDAAKKVYEGILQDKPKHMGALLGLASLARAAGDRAGAERWMLKAHDANPQALQPMLILAEGYLRKNESLKAVNMLSGASPEQAGQPAVMRLRGMAQLQSGDYSSAVATLSRLTAKAPQAIEGWFQLARAQAAAGDIDASRASFTKAAELDESHKVPVVWIGLGELEVREGRYQEALAVADRVKEGFPKLAYGYDLAASAYRGLGDVEKTLAELRAALELDRTSRRVDSYSRTLAAAGKDDDAVAALQDWLNDHPDDGKTWGKLGLIHQRFGREDAALTAYEKSIESNEPDAVLANNMAWLYLGKDKAKAMKLATKAYELAPSRAEIVDTYGWVLFRNNRKNEGLTALQQALVIAPRNPEIALHVAEALHELKRDSEARPVLQRILREHPKTEFATTARKLLDQLRG